MYVSNYIVGFIDVLGQRAAFESNSDFFDGTNYDAATKFIKESYAKVEWMKGILSKSIDGYQKVEKTNTEKAGWIIPEVKYSRFSDCLEFHSSMISKEGNEMQIASLYGILSSSAIICLLSHVQGFAIRGGVAIGMGIENIEGSVYGPALYEAVVLESQKALYPRIVVNKRVIDYIYAIESKPQITDKDKVEASIARECREMLIVEGDVTFVHFLSRRMLDMLPGTYYEDILQPFKESILKNLEKYKENDRVRSKFEWIMEYDNGNEKLLDF